MNRLLFVLGLSCVVGCECLPDDSMNGGTLPGSIAGKLTVFEGALSAPNASYDSLQKFPGLRQALRTHAPLSTSAPALNVGAIRNAVHRPALPISKGGGVLMGVGLPERFVPGDVVVRLEERLTAAQALALLQKQTSLPLVHGGFASQWLHLVHATKADGSELSVGQTRELVNVLARVPGVRFAELNGVRSALAVPNDPLYTTQWHYPAMNLPATWDLTKGLATSVVAIIDTGIITHPDLAPKLLPGADLISDVTNAGDGDGRDTNPNDEGGDQPNGGSSWHGSHVAGTIGASSDNAAGVSGVNWNAKLLPVRVLGKRGGTDFDISAGITWASGGAVPGVPTNANPASVLNLSLGGRGSATQTYQDAIDAANGRGAVLLVAAGNDNIDASQFTPCNQQNVICIGAVRFDGSRASYSNFGARVDVMAPGGEMAEDRNGDRYPDGVLSTGRDNGEPAYVFEQGTSMATPHVAGVVSLMKARNPGLTFAQALMLLTSTANTNSRCNEGCGAGLINAHAAVQAAAGSAPTGPAKLASTTNELFFTTGTATQSLSISNVGGAPLTVQFAATGTVASRLRVGGAQMRTLQPNQSDTVVIQADFAGLAEGVHAGAVVLSSNGGALSVNARLRVGSAARHDAVIGLVFQKPDESWDVAGAALASAANGYTYSLTADAGAYYAFAFVDSNDNNDLDDGEPLGLYPNMDSPRELTLVSDTTLLNIDFTLAPDKPVSDTESRQIGLVCGSDPQCPNGGFCVTAWPNGYCSRACSTSACPTGSTCVDTGEVDSMMQAVKVCLAPCAGPGLGQSSCRASYVCYDDGTGAGICLPACASSADCAGQTCNTQTGYCQ